MRAGEGVSGRHREGKDETWAAVWLVVSLDALGGKGDGCKG